MKALRRLRHVSPPIVAMTLTSFVLSLLPPRVARAESGGEPAPEIETPPAPVSSQADAPKSGNEPVQSAN